jgi:galactokinase
MRRASAPGRVCLLGEDLDWMGGPSIQAAIDIRVVYAASWGPRGTPFSVTTSGYRRASAAFSDAWSPVSSANEWATLVKECASVSASPRALHWPSRAEVHSQLPWNAGLASSAAVVVAGLTAYCGPQETLPLLERAWWLESVKAGRAVGRMDYLPCITGGVVFARWSEEGAADSTSLSLPADTDILIIDTQEARDTSTIIRAKRRRWEDRESAIIRYRSRIDELTDSMRRLLTSDAGLSSVGQVLTEAHRSMRDDLHCSTVTIERCVVEALKAGALGAKVTGTGHGGCVLALTMPSATADVVQQMTRLGLPTTVTSVTPEGVQLLDGP